MIKIALVICTRNNPQKLQVTLDALAKLSIPRIVSLVLVDQSTQDSKLQLPTNLPVDYLKTPDQIGASKAKNVALTVTTAQVLAWTDDDCILTQSYIDRLVVISQLAPTAERKKIAGVCGRTLPYLPTRPSQKYTCPSTFSKSSNQAPVTQVCVHWRQVGLGNNLVIFRHIFKNLGGFKEWLGPGSIGKSAEDGEIMLRSLAAGNSWLYDDKLLIHHNKWLDANQAVTQERDYACGGLALYGGYALRGFPVCRPEFQRELRFSGRRLREHLRSMKRQPTQWFQYAQLFWQECWVLVKGIFLAGRLASQF